MITKRTLERWRREALTVNKLLTTDPVLKDDLWKDYMAVNERVLRLTQELLDQHLMRGK
jgi:hypothetical protein